MPSRQAMRYFTVFSYTPVITFLEQRTIINATGITHTAARAILQSKKKRLMTTSVVEINAPTSSGIQ